MNCWWVFLIGFFATAAEAGGLKIIGGNDAKISDVPYQLQLEMEGYLYCGASIIDDFFAVTSAACVDGVNQRKLTVRAGTDRRSYGGQIHQVLRVNIHPKYDSVSLDYDIAVLEVATPFRFDDTTKSVTLTTAEAAAGDLVRISGWGTTSEGGSGVNQLQSLDIPVFPRKNCTEIYSGDVSDRMICAGLEGQDACRGDGGSPLVRIRDLVQVGIRSWGYGCAREGYPGIYTNIADPEITDFITCIQNSNCN